jgi:hypothetical protein
MMKHFDSLELAEAIGSAISQCAQRQAERERDEAEHNAQMKVERDAAAEERRANIQIAYSLQRIAEALERIRCEGINMRCSR